jgi:hypothetical protein
MTTVVPPTWVIVRSWAMRPVTWKSGTATNVRSSGPRPRQRSKVITELMIPRWVPIAPLGRPVVPEVYMTNAVSSSPTSTAGGVGGSS